MGICVLCEPYLVLSQICLLLFYLIFLLDLSFALEAPLYLLPLHISHNPAFLNL